MKWLQLVRWKNLLIVFFTQLLVWYCLIYGNGDSIKNFITCIPGSWIYETETSFWEYFQYFLLIASSTLLIAAAGYIINDYFDLKIDVINRPEKVVLEKKIPLRTAILAHTLLNVLAFLLAGIIAFRARHPEWLLIQVVCTTLLWFYSTHFKKQFIVGNVVVASLTAFTIVVLVVYFPTIRSFLRWPAFVNNNSGQFFLNPLWICGAYCFFAFMTTWMREIVKDMEDHKGDAAEGCMTMPIKMGLQFSARFAQFLGIITIAVLGIISWHLLNMSFVYLAAYAVAFIVLPLIIWCIYLSRKNTTAHYHNASRWLKVIMLTGIGSLIVYHFSI